MPTTAPTAFKCNEAMDIALVIDSSSSIKDHWDSLKQFLVKVIDEFNFGPDGIVLAVVTYATEPRKIFGFDPNRSKGLLKMDISTLEPMGGGL